MKKMLLAVSYGPVIAGLLAIGTTGFTSCKKKEEDVPPAPSAVVVAPAPTPVVIAPEEDAGAPEIVDAAPDVKKVVHGQPADVAGLRACCSALQQNAASMPPPNNAYALQAAAVCQSLVAGLAAGAATKVGALGSLTSMMKGAGLPPACH